MAEARRIGSDYGFIANPVVPNGFAPISSMLGIAGQAQALQSGNLSLQKQRETLATDIERAKAEAARSVTEAGVSAQTAQPRVSQATSQAATAQTQSETAAFELRNRVSSVGLNEAAALVQNPAIIKGDPEGIAEALSQSRKRMIDKGVPPHIAEGLTAELMVNARKPGAVHQQLQDIIRANAGPGTQAGVINAPLTPVSTGGAITPVQLQPGAPGAVQPGQAMPVTVPPTALENIETDALGNKHIVSRSPQGAILSSRPVPSGAPQTTQPGFTSFQPGERDDIPILARERAQTNSAALNARTQLFNNEQIIEISKDPQTALALTGPGAEKWARIAGAVGIPWTGNRAENFNKLAHFLALQTEQNAAAMGAGTDAARQLSGRVAGSTEMTPAALSAIAKVNNAFATGTLQFNDGMEAAIKNAGGNVLAARQFKNEWARHFDPDVYRYANALKAGDKEEINLILGKTPEGKPTPASIAKAKDLARKSQALNALSTKGGL